MFYQIWEVWLYPDCPFVVESMFWAVLRYILKGTGHLFCCADLPLSFLGFPFPASSIPLFNVVVPFSPHGHGFSAFNTWSRYPVVVLTPSCLFLHLFTMFLPGGDVFSCSVACLVISWRPDSADMLLGARFVTCL